MGDGGLDARIQGYIERRIEENRVIVRRQMEEEWAGREAAHAPGPGAAPIAVPVAAPRRGANTAHPENYDGRVQSLNQWLFRVKLYLGTIGVEETSKEAVDTAVSYLVKDGFSWWYQLSDRVDRGAEQPILTWDAFVTAIKGRFLVVDEDRNARIALTQLRQTTTVRVYIQEFQRLTMLAPDTLERDQVVRFTLGLQRDVRAEVDRGHPETVLAAMKLADESEVRLHGFRQDRPSQPAAYHPRRNVYTGPTGMELGTVSAAAGRPRPGRGGRPSVRGGQRPAMQQGNAAGGYAGGQNIKCYNCGKLGHIARNCQESSRPQQQGNGPARA